MAAPFSVTSVANYNSNPPTDDGATTTANRIDWSKTKTKIGDPLKTAFDASETATLAAFAKILGGAGILTTAVDYTVLAADQGKLVKVTASGKTITTPDATVVGSPFYFGVVNESTGNITFAGNNPGVQQNIDGAASITVPPGNGLIAGTDGTNWFTFGQNFTKSFPPVASFKNLSIKVASNTTVTVAADAIAVGNGAGKYQTLAFSGTINLGTTGANALDTGTIAIDTWYAIHAIAKDDGTTALLASTSATTPTMPSGYTYSGRIGWVRTIHASATLYGTWQLGRRAQYIVGLAQTSALPGIFAGAVGTYSDTAPVWQAESISSVVPTTASVIDFILTNRYNNGVAANLITAPNNSYGGPRGTNPCWNYFDSGTVGTQTVSMLLESTNIYFASSATGGGALATGWTDNI